MAYPFNVCFSLFGFGNNEEVVEEDNIIVESRPSVFEETSELLTGNSNSHSWNEYISSNDINLLI